MRSMPWMGVEDLRRLKILYYNIRIWFNKRFAVFYQRMAKIALVMLNRNVEKVEKFLKRKREENE